MMKMSLPRFESCLIQTNRHVTSNNYWKDFLEAVIVELVQAQKSLLIISQFLSSAEAN